MPVCSNLYLREFPLISCNQAHIKSAIVGASITIPIKDGKLVSINLSLFHHRDYH